MKNNAYYEQEGLWQNTPEAYQVQVLCDILSLIPSDTGSIVDIGCGNGLITNRLPETIPVLGIDVSEEALKQVKRDKQVGSITEIPLSDDEFDMIMANDIIEHIPDAMYEKALEELFRVAARYVLITVPYGEDLEKAKAKCSECGALYHENHHKHSFVEDDLLRLCPKGWRVVEVRYSGDTTRMPYDDTIALRRELGFYATFEQCICEACGSKDFVRPEGELTMKLLDKLRADRLYGNIVRKAGTYVDRTEAIVLFVKEEWAQAYRTLEIMEKDEEYDETLSSVLHLDFTNPHQLVSGFVEGNSWSRAYLDRSDENTLTALVCFPVASRKGDRISVRTTTDTEDLNLSVFGRDYYKNVDIILPLLDKREGGIAVFEIEDPWNPTKYGTQVFMQIKGDAELVSATYLTNEQEPFEVPFIHLNRGHSVLKHEAGGYIRSWGFYTKEECMFPKLMWLFSGELNEVRIAEAAPTMLDVKELMEKNYRERESNDKINSLTQEISSLNQKVSSLNMLANNVEAACAEAEKEWPLKSRELLRWSRGLLMSLGLHTNKK